jgi:inward rectifier potassium channel
VVSTGDGGSSDRRTRLAARASVCDRMSQDATPSRPPVAAAPSPAAEPSARARVDERPRSQDIVRIGVRKRPLTDVYHFLLTSPWSVLFGLMLVLYLGLNACFALAYLVDGGVENARPGDFGDAYFFSVQTMATIGYGKMTPRSTFANIVVTFEALVGLVGLALATGLVFAKFSQPRARVIFGRYAVVGERDGVRSLMVRLANERKTGLVEAQLRLVLLRDEKTLEGEDVRRFHTLTLSRSSSTVFALSWTAIHPIDEASPLFGQTRASLEASRADLIASLVGLEDATGQTVHARHTWRASAILFGHRFVDILVHTPEGHRAIDYRRFHDVERVAGSRDDW